MSEPLQDAETAATAKTFLDDFDNPWKQVLEHCFEAFILFFLPLQYKDIDWKRGYHFLDYTLHKLVRKSEQKTRYADKLVQVWRTNGEGLWLLIPIEIQCQKDNDFGERMFVSYYRIYDRFRCPIVSLAILADTDEDWCVNGFETEQVWETQAVFQFQSVKVLDYAKQWKMLEANTNPFATVVMAHLKTISHPRRHGRAHGMEAAADSAAV